MRMYRLATWEVLIMNIYLSVVVIAFMWKHVVELYRF